MNKFGKNEFGFNVVGIMLVVIVVTIVGLVGYTIYKNKHKTASTGTSTTQNTPSEKSTIYSSGEKQATKRQITNEQLASADLLAFLEQDYDAFQTTECKLAQDRPAQYTIQKITRNTFAKVDRSCNMSEGAHAYYVKQNDLWKFLIYTQQSLACDMVNQYKISKEIADVCYTGTNVIANNNL